ncbi:MAG: zinc-dependent metalloprotease [Planctomycetes bacterium]|nr:zinc-dependent metalloprotease [Planctomycetota bacterium]
MRNRLFSLRFFAAFGLCLIVLSQALAEEAKKPTQPQPPPYEQLTSGARTIDGFIKMHQKGTKLLGEISPDNLNKDMMVLIAIARGIGEMPLLGGMTWDRGDDWIWQFRKVDERIQIVRRNVRFRAAKGSPQEKAVHLSYTDSILYSLPILTKSPKGGFMVDLTPVFMGDLPQISKVLKGFTFAPDRSSWSELKGFKDNVEIEVAATYASGGAKPSDTVPDTRGVTIHIHYSISRLKQTGYKPRLADDRVGHFLTVIKDFSKSGENDRFVRYINRWDLRKADPSAKVSPPATPIIFWIDKTVPYEFRAAVREGILEWNITFEKVGFSNAIEVRQQPDNAQWDAEDINYNTFRWITTSMGFARGPCRVNPTTGQILDADIIFDADFVEFWASYLGWSDTGKAVSASADPLDISGLPGANAQAPFRLGRDCLADGEYTRGMAQQMAFGTMALAAAGKGKGKLDKEEIEKLLFQGVRSIATHEVGHTLGLRHNFKASTMLTMDELNDLEKTRKIGMASSVMDYLPANVSPQGKKQGDYFNLVCGPYDYWVIEYAYKPLPGGTEKEVAELRKIASRCTQPELQYATDEDARGLASDPLVNPFDLSKDPIEFAGRRVELINQVLPELVDRVTEPGDSYERVRQAFSIILREHGRAMHFVARFIGGVHVYRDHKGDTDARPPFVPTDPKKQREALTFLEKNVLGPEALRIPPKLYDFLAPHHWYQWGKNIPKRPDIAVHDTVLSMQDMVLAQVMSPVTLSRVLDTELKVPADQDAFTAAELLDRLTATVFKETENLKEGKFTNRKPAIDSLRRNLQQRYFRRLADLALGKAPAPTDCQTLAAAELDQLEVRLREVLGGKAQLDDYTRAHLSELAARIRKVLDARLDLGRP